MPIDAVLAPLRAVALGAIASACTPTPDSSGGDVAVIPDANSDVTSAALHCTLGPATPFGAPASVPESIAPCSNCTVPACVFDRTFTPIAVWSEPGGTLALRGSIRVETDQGDYTHVAAPETLALTTPKGVLSWTAATCEPSWGQGILKEWSRPWLGLRVVGGRASTALLQAYTAQGALAWSSLHSAGRLRPVDRLGSDGLYLLADDPHYTQLNSLKQPVGLLEVNAAGKVVHASWLQGKDLQVLGVETDAAGVRLLLLRKASLTAPPLGVRWVRLGWDGEQQAAHEVALPDQGTLTGINAVPASGMDGWLLTVGSLVAPEKGAQTYLRINGQGSVLWTAPRPQAAEGTLRRAYPLASGATILLLWNMPYQKPSQMTMLRLDGAGQQLGTLRVLDAPVASPTGWDAWWSEFGDGYAILVGTSGTVTGFSPGEATADTAVGVYDFAGNLLAGAALGIAPPDMPVSVARLADRLVIVRKTMDAYGNCPTTKDPCYQVLQVPLACSGP